MRDTDRREGRKKGFEGFMWGMMEGGGEGTREMESGEQGLQGQGGRRNWILRKRSVSRVHQYELDVRRSVRFRTVRHGRTDRGSRQT